MMRAQSDESNLSPQQSDDNAPIIDLTEYTLLRSAGESLQSTVWRYSEWLNSYPLHIHTVMDYFKYCPFYDKQCNNELITTQQLSITQLVNMTGIEYSLHELSNNTQLIINKCNRLNQHDVELIQSYYISTNEADRGTVYILPYLNDIINYNLQTSLYYINSMSELLYSHIQYDIGNKYYLYNFNDNSDERITDNIAARNEIDRHEYTNLVNDNIRLLVADTTNK